jgi:nitroreductase
VVKSDKRAVMVRVMRQGLAQMRALGQDTGSIEGSARAMEQAPVTVFVFCPGGWHPWRAQSIEQAFIDVVDIHSIGAAIRNLMLAAQNQGPGSSWTCDILYTYEELSAWLGVEGQMTAAVSFGYPAESPDATRRKSVTEVIRRI